MTENSDSERKILQGILSSLDQVSEEGRERILRTVSTFYDLDLSNGQRLAPIETRAAIHVPSTSRDLSFGDRANISPKDFLRDKQPRTDIERVACHAYYLLHYRETPHFKNIDISKLNTESAQVKFSNPAAAVANATSAHLIAAAGRGKKQISDVGDRFVDALPDREEAKAVLTGTRKRRSRKKGSSRKKTRKIRK